MGGESVFAYSKTRCVLITQPSKQGELCRKDERNANHKSPVLGLVVNGAHRQIDTGAAAENAQRKQRFFRARAMRRAGLRAYRVS